MEVAIVAEQLNTNANKIHAPVTLPVNVGARQVLPLVTPVQPQNIRPARTATLVPVIMIVVVVGNTALVLHVLQTLPNVLSTV